jgi:predicted ATPase/transcriptional regulator with XRE-family HTH domain
MRSDAEPAGETRSPFGELLREFRLAANLSQETLAERAGVSVSGISALERGTRRAPHRDTVALLTSALELPAQDRSRLQAAAAHTSVPRQRGIRAAGDGGLADHHLPLPLTSFHGRARELCEIAEAIAEHRLVTLIGAGGIGKTRLGLEAARGISERFSDGVRYVELAPVSDSAFVVQRIASTLGIAFRDGPSEPNNAWIVQLVEKQLLIVLDNCEHVLDAAATVTQQILERCPDVRVLATSREALRIGGEYVVRVDPLAVPATSADRPSTLAEVRASPAATLFLDRARLVAPSLMLGDDAVACQTLADICARLDGMPLAIELAAARMNALTLATLLRSLDGRFHVLTTGARTALPRHQTLRALIDWSHDLLGESERRVFRRLGIFAGGWTLEAAQTICTDDAVSPGELLVILSSLVDKSLALANLTPNGIRYSMLETTRAYALERLSDQGEREPAARGHAEYFRDFLCRNNTRWGVLPIAEWLAPLECELDNLRAALGWCVAEGHELVLGTTIAMAQQPALEALSLAHEGISWSKRALAALSVNPPAVLEATLQSLLARSYAAEGYHEQTVGPAMRSAALYRTLSEPLMLGVLSPRACLALSLAFAGFALAALRRPGEAADAATEAVVLARMEPHVSILAWALIAKSFSAGDIAARRALLDEALGLSRSFPSGYTFEGLALIGLAIAEFDAGEIDLARLYSADAAEHYRRTGFYENNACWAICNASMCACLAGDGDCAIAYAREGLADFRGGRLFFLIDLVQVIANVLTLRGRPRDAARLTGACEKVYADRGNRLSCAQAVYDRTIALLREGSSSLDVDGWLTEGQGWSLEEAIDAALEFEQRSQRSASTSYG